MPSARLLYETHSRLTNALLVGFAAKIISCRSTGELYGSINGLVR
jgi:hypothetical protein